MMGEEEVFSPPTVRCDAQNHDISGVLEYAVAAIWFRFFDGSGKDPISFAYDGGEDDCWKLGQQPKKLAVEHDQNLE
ncbi:hypothetical protein Tco_1568854 [Tanacetum coccineum]